MYEGPRSLTIVRHAVSLYNESKNTREADPEYQAFKKAYATDWQGAEARKLAVNLRKKLVIPGGESETPIHEDFKWQAQNTGQYLYDSDNWPNKVIVSPYLRTRQTLEQLTVNHPPLFFEEPIIEPRIREREHGISPSYGDKKIFFIHNPQERAKYEQSSYSYRYPGGENIEDVMVRVDSWLEDLKETAHGDDVLVVTHHETILVMRMLLEGLSPQDYVRIDHEDTPINCGVTRYVDEGDGYGLELEYYNKNMFSSKADPILLD